jgi:hypothetical protein
VLTRRAGADLCALAEDVVRRLPDVQEALASGVIDHLRARGRNAPGRARFRAGLNPPSVP